MQKFVFSKSQILTLFLSACLPTMLDLYALQSERAPPCAFSHTSPLTPGNRHKERSHIPEHITPDLGNWSQGAQIYLHFGELVTINEG